jgi:hypothetical protein
MSFKLHKEARDWFSGLFGKEPFGTLFDCYQTCLVLGLARERYEFDDKAMEEFMDEFTQRYRPHQTIIVGTLVSTAIQRKGITSSDSQAVAEEIGRLVSGDSSRGDLTPEGFKEMNRYALGGFNMLRERFDLAPSNTAAFFEKYRDLLEETEQEIQI